MKINEILKEGFWSGLGNLAHGAVLGATTAMRNAPKALSVDTRLAADPKQMKALPTTFNATPTTKEQPPSEKPDIAPVNVPGFTVTNQEPVVVRYKNNDYSLNNQGEWYSLSARGTKIPLVKDYNPTLEKLLDKVAGF